MTPPARRALVHRLALAGLAGADAGRLLREALQAHSSSANGTVDAPPWVIAAGKVAGPMLETFLAWCDGRVAGGVIVAPSNVARHWPGLRAFSGGHPVPTLDSLAAGDAALACASARSAHEHAFVLLSGGASALLAAPAGLVTLADKVAVTRTLLSHGAPIDGLNTVRKHLSRVKGGRLAAAARCHLHTFALSDVIRPFPDDPATIGSGPTVADPTTFDDALAVLHAFAEPSDVPPAVFAHLEAGRAGRIDDTPKPGDIRLAASTHRVIGNGTHASSAVAALVRDLGIEVQVRPVPFEGEARVAADTLLEEALAAAKRSRRPFCYVATGETTVTVKGRGLGGRNQELALAAALSIGTRGIEATLVSIGTDGVDGPTSAAGAIADETTLSRALAKGLGPARASLAENDSHSYLAALGDTVQTGPTRTNVGDLVVILLP